MSGIISNRMFRTPSIEVSTDERGLLHKSNVCSSVVKSGRFKSLSAYSKTIGSLEHMTFVKDKILSISISNSVLRNFRFIGCSFIDLSTYESSIVGCQFEECEYHARSKIERTKVIDSEFTYSGMKLIDRLTAGSTRVPYFRDCNFQHSEVTDVDLSRVFGCSFNAYSEISKKVISLTIYPYPVTISEKIIRIGCQEHSPDRWFSFSDEEIWKMDDKSLEWWKAHKETIRSLHRSIVETSKEA